MTLASPFNFVLGHGIGWQESCRSHQPLCHRWSIEANRSMPRGRRGGSPAIMKSTFGFAHPTQSKIGQRFEVPRTARYPVSESAPFRPKDAPCPSCRAALSPFSSLISKAAPRSGSGTARRWRPQSSVILSVLDSAIQAHGGIHFKTIGDAVQAAFPAAPAAVAAACDAQRALLAEEWGGRTAAGCAWPCTPGRPNRTRVATTSRPR